MSKTYGMMDSYDNCIAWVEALEVPDKDYKQRVLNRMRYERDKQIPVKPKFHKGHYGKKFDYYTCGKCGVTMKDGVGDNYCWNCGFRIGWDSTRCLTGLKENDGNE